MRIGKILRELSSALRAEPFQPQEPWVMMGWILYAWAIPENKWEMEIQLVKEKGEESPLMEEVVEQGMVDSPTEEDLRKTILFAKFLKKVKPDPNLPVDLGSKRFKELFLKGYKTYEIDVFDHIKGKGPLTLNIKLQDPVGLAVADLSIMDLKRRSSIFQDYKENLEPYKSELLSGTWLWFNRLNVPATHRGKKGIGTALMTEITNIADRKDYNIFNWATSYESTPEMQIRLESFYKRFGFKKIVGSTQGSIMIRLAR